MPGPVYQGRLESFPWLYSVSTASVYLESPRCRSVPTYALVFPAGKTLERRLLETDHERRVSGGLVPVFEVPVPYFFVLLPCLLSPIVPHRNQGSCSLFRHIFPMNSLPGSAKNSSSFYVELAYMKREL